jgi:hypothetical protein
MKTYNNTLLEDMRHLARVHKGMLDRTRFEKKYYGKIRVYKRWIKNPLTFCLWAIEHGWRRGLQIDRKNNAGHYQPWNVRFVTKARNLANRTRPNGAGFKAKRGVDREGHKLPMNITLMDGFYCVLFNRNGKRYWVGQYKELNIAIKKRDAAIKRVERSIYDKCR